MSKLIHYYLKTRIIPLSLELPNLMTQMANTPFKDFDAADNYSDSLVYEQALFLSKFKNSKFLKLDTLAGSEKTEFELALKKLNEFSDFQAFLYKGYVAFTSARNCQLKFTTDIMNSNLIMTQEVCLKDYKSRRFKYAPICS